MPKSQERQILGYLQAGNSLTPLDALEKFRCFRLGARVFDLIQQGYPIKSEIVKGENGKHFAKYWLPNTSTIPQISQDNAQGGDISPKVDIQAAEPLPQAQRQAFEDRTGQMAFLQV